MHNPDIKKTEFPARIGLAGYLKIIQGYSNIHLDVYKQSAYLVWIIKKNGRS